MHVGVIAAESKRVTQWEPQEVAHGFQWYRTLCWKEADDMTNNPPQRKMLRDIGNRPSHGLKYLSSSPHITRKCSDLGNAANQGSP